MDSVARTATKNPPGGGLSRRTGGHQRPNSCMAWAMVDKGRWKPRILAAVQTAGAEARTVRPGEWAMKVSTASAARYNSSRLTGSAFGNLGISRLWCM